MVAVELGGDGEDTVVDGSDIGQVVQLRLPVNVGLPETVRAEVCAYRQQRALIRAVG